MNLSEPSLSYYRMALKWGLDFNNTLLQGAQHVRRYQMEQIDAAMAQSATFSQDLEAASSQDELVAVGTQLTSGQWRRTMDYWGGLSNALGQNQVELLGAVQARALELADGLKQGLDEAPAAIPEPIASTLKLVAEVARTTLNARPNSLNGSADHQPSSYQNGKPAACRLPPAACRLPPAACRQPPAACRQPPPAAASRRKSQQTGA
jgi:hypothetical protein